MTFAKQVGTFITKANLETDKEFGKQALALYVDIVRGTPVRDGILQNNWQLSSNQANAKKDTETKPGKDTSGAISRGAANAKGLKITDTAIIFNNMEYANAVENGLGKGRRIPAKMVALAIIAAQARNSI